VLWFLQHFERCLKNRCHSSRTEGFVLSCHSAVGKVPGETEHILGHNQRKATDFKHGGTVEGWRARLV